MKPTTVVIALFFFMVTVLLGLAMRWDLATGVVSQWGLSFPNLRHAHSHAGYYGVLTIGWWLSERRAGVAMHRTVVTVYAGTALVATVAFTFMGYRPFTIVLSTVVASLWVVMGIRRWRRADRRAKEWLDCALPGLIIGVSLIPVVAVTARRDLGLSREIAHVFVTTILLTVFIPAAWQALRRRRRVSLFIFVPLVVMTSVRIVFMDRAPVPFAIAGCLLSVLTTWVIVSEPLDGLVKLGWLILPASLLAGMFSSSAHGDALRIAGLHLLILGPVLTSLYPSDEVGPGLKWAYRSTLLLMVVSIASPATLLPANPPLATAVASSVFAAIALLAGFTVRTKSEDELFRSRHPVTSCASPIAGN